jgi:hypothetical protein
MIRSLILKSSAALACAAMALAFVQPVQAASFSFSDSNCDSFTLGGTIPNQTLTCVVSNAPSGCSISGPNTGTTGTPITLTSTCATGSANQWAWTGGTAGNCQGLTSQSCQASSTSSGTVTYTVTARNAVGAAPPSSITVNWSNTPPQAPTGCTLTALPTSLPIGGGSVALTTTCSGGGAPTSYAWTASPTPAGFSATAGFSQTVTISASTFFTVTPSNGGGNGNQATVSVNVATNNPGFCSQYSNVLPIVNATWGQSANWFSTAGGNFGDGNTSVWVIKLTVPAGTPLSAATGSFNVSEYQGPSTIRQMTLSTQACDFRGKDYTGATGPLAVSNGSTGSIIYGVATPFVFGPAGLSAGQTYYINVRNWQLDPSPQSSCAQSTCNAIMNDTAASP